MKKEIVAYITALINTCNTTVNVPILSCLNDLLNYVEDIQDDDTKSKGYIELVEKICDNFVEKNCELVQVLQKQKNTITTLEFNNSVWKNIYDELKEENKKLKSDVFDKKGELNK